MTEKIQTKDLIRVGVFTAIYVVIFFATGMLGYIPVLFVLLPVIIPIVTGIPFMLFLTKVNKFGLVTIMGSILGLFMFATGHTWVPLITGISFGFLADVILKISGYKSFRMTMISYGIFSLWCIGAMLPMWLMRESYFAYIEANMGKGYTDAVLALTPSWMPFAIFVVAFISGLIGANFGRAVLKKHFERAGIA